MVQGHGPIIKLLKNATCPSRTKQRPAGYFAMSRMYSINAQLRGCGRFGLNCVARLSSIVQPRLCERKSKRYAPRQRSCSTQLLTSQARLTALQIEGQGRFVKCSCSSRPRSRASSRPEGCKPVCALSASMRTSISCPIANLHSISGFRAPPTIAIPSDRRPSGSFARTIVLAGNMGLSGVTCAASLAACSIASISSLQPAWSNGQTTMG